MISLRTKALKFALKTIEPFQDRLNRIYLFKKAFQLLYDKFAPDEWILVEVEGVKMYVNTRDRAISRFILQQGCYEKGTTKVFKNVVKEGMTVIDIGACFGYYSLIAASLVGKEGRVFAFEPHPFNYEWLIKNIHLNGFRNIFPYKKAVADKKGIAKLFCTNDIVGHSIISRQTSVKIIEVETISLKEFLEENRILPDVIKMDIEGAENDVIRDLKKKIEEMDNLMIFLEAEHINRETFSFLNKHFQLYYIQTNGQLHPFNSQSNEEGDFEEKILCVKREL